MRTIKTPLRLEAHRIKYKRYAGVCELLNFHDLTDVEKAFLADELMKDVKIRRLTFFDQMDEHEYNEKFLALLNEWGIMCSHPRMSMQKTKTGYKCGVCHCVVIDPRVQKNSVRIDR